MATARVNALPIRNATVAAAFLLSATVAGCNGDSETVERDAGIYAAVIDTVVGDAPFADLDDPLAVVVWVYPLADDVIDLEVQVEVLVLLEEYATIRFVDDFEEAVDEDAAGQPVLEAGVAVGLGPVPGEAPVSVRAERYAGDGSPEALRLDVRRSDGDVRAEIDES